jgi:hypothetical protein
LPAWVERKAAASANETGTEAMLRQRFGAISEQYSRVRNSTLPMAADEQTKRRLRMATREWLIAEQDLQQLEDVEGRTAHSALLMQINKDLETLNATTRVMDQSLKAH